MTRRGCQVPRVPRAARRPPAPLLRALVAASLLPAALLRSQPAEKEPAGGREPLLEILLENEAERLGDYDALAVRSLEALAGAAGDFRGELLLRRLRELGSSLREPLALAPLLERALESPELRGVSRLVALDWLSSLARRRGERERAKELLATGGFLRRFAVAGPFGKDLPAPLERELPPERELDLAARYRDGWQEISWRVLEPREDTPQVEPLAEVYPSRGVSYLLAQVEVEEDREAVLHFGAKEKLKLWLNGTLLVDDTRAAAPLATRRAAGIRLRRGWNRILVKATSGPLWLRLADPRGEGLEGFSEEAGLTLHPSPGEAPARWDGPFAAGALAPWAEALAASRESAREAAPGEEGSLALEHLGLGLLWGFYGRWELAVREVERALELAPGRAAILYHAGRVFRQASYLPENTAKGRSEALWKEALAADPAFAPARLELARTQRADGKGEEAAELLREALSGTPGFFPALLELASVLDSLGWEADARRALARAGRLAPAHPAPAIEEGRRYERRGNLEAAAERYLAAWDRDRRQDTVLGALARLRVRQGRPEAAEELLRARLALEPRSLERLAELAAHLVDRERPAEAVDLWLEAAGGRPWDPRAWRGLGEALEEAGRSEEAHEAYRRALALAPGELALSRYAAYREGRESEERFWEPHDEALEDWLERIPSRGPLVEKASALYVLDLSVIRVLPDGSSVEYTHQAVKLLAERAKESVARVEVPGEVVLLRTLRADKRELEPVPALGKHRFVLPGVEPGAIAELAWRLERPRSEGGPFESPRFYFQDREGERAFLLSRFVLLLPPGFPERALGEVLPRAPGLAGVERSARELEGGGQVVVYEARQVERLEREPGIPQLEEYLPHVEVDRPWDWQALGEALRAQVAGRTLRTPELERAAAEAAAGLEDPEARARALHAWVDDLVASPEGPRSAVAVLLERAGDRAVLFKALLDLAEVPASWAFLRPAESFLSPADWTRPRPELFPWPAVLVELEGKEPLWVSLSARAMPFGALPEHLAGGKAYVLGPEGERLVALPPLSPERYATVTEARVRLGEGSRAEVELRIASRAWQSLRQKERLRTLPAFQKEQLGRLMANQLFPGARVSQAAFEGLDDRDRPLTFVAALEAPRLLRPSGERLLFPCVLDPLEMVRRHGGPAERRFPYHLRLRQASFDRVRVEVGEGLVLERVPAATVLGHELGTYSLRFSERAGGVEVARELTLEPGWLEPGEFPGFLEFLEGIDRAERRSIVLRKGSKGGRREER